MEGSQMRDSHRMFLQAFMSKGVMNTSEVKATFIQSKNKFAEPFETENVTGQITHFVRMINLAIAPFNLEIRKGIQEHDGSSVYCLVNTVESVISRLSSTYTPNELELFKKVIEHIVESSDGFIGSRDAINLTEKLEKRMGKEDAQNFLNHLEMEKWIIKGGDGKIALSVRSILELDQYLQEMYPALVKKCNICNMISLQGESCGKCAIKIHYRCAEKLFSKQTERKCPVQNCRAPWGQDQTSS